MNREPEEDYSYEAVIGRLRKAYDAGADNRDQTRKGSWKLIERQTFLDRLLSESKTSLLEVGAGTGQDSLFFQSNGLEVLATDLSAQMVAYCKRKGLSAKQADLLNLGLPAESFDAVYSMNCFLHVPNADLPNALKAIHQVLKPGGLFFLGVYGGEVLEGEALDDWHVPPRFFSFRSDEQMLSFTSRSFEVLDFHVVGSQDRRFQSMTLRKRGLSG